MCNVHFTRLISAAHPRNTSMQQCDRINLRLRMPTNPLVKNIYTSLPAIFAWRPPDNREKVINSYISNPIGMVILNENHSVAHSRKSEECLKFKLFLCFMARQSWT